MQCDIPQVPFIAVMLFFIMPYVSMSLFASGKGVFVEDVHGRLYHPLQWYLAKLTVSLPYNALLATALQLEFYGLAGMRHGAGVMAQAWLVSVLMGLIAVQVGLREVVHCTCLPITPGCAGPAHCSAGCIDACVSLCMTACAKVADSVWSVAKAASVLEVLRVLHIAVHAQCSTLQCTAQLAAAHATTVSPCGCNAACDSTIHLSSLRGTIMWLRY